MTAAEKKYGQLDITWMLASGERRVLWLHVTGGVRGELCTNWVAAWRHRHSSPAGRTPPGLNLCTQQHCVAGSTLWWGNSGWCTINQKLSVWRRRHKWTEGKKITWVTTVNKQFDNLLGKCIFIVGKVYIHCQRPWTLLKSIDIVFIIITAIIPLVVVFSTIVVIMHPRLYSCSL